MNILHVESNSDDRALFHIALKRSNPDVRLRAVVDAPEAIQHLEGGGRYADRTRYLFPDLLVFAVRLQGMDGFQFLGWLGSSPYADLPAIILTDSLAPETRNRALSGGALAVFEKPHDFSALVRATAAICNLGSPGLAGYRSRNFLRAESSA
jgi:CheY-like chemotaxis protein